MMRIAMLGTRHRSGKAEATSCVVEWALLIPLLTIIMASSSYAQRTAPSIPEDAIAYYRLDPSAFHSSAGAASFLPMLVRVAESSGLIDPEFHPLFDGIAAAGIAGGVPHTVCILDADAEFDAESKNGFRMLNLESVLVLETPSNHRTYLQTLTSILDHYTNEHEAADAQEIFQLPDGTAAGRFQPESWPDWRAIEWSAGNTSFVVGLGKGSLANWTGAQRTAPDQAHITRHRTAITTVGGDASSTTFLEVWINFDRLHERMPDILAQGRPRRMLTTWKLDDARSWMLHGHKRDKWLLFDITWQRRSESPDVVAHRSLTLDHWPNDLALPEPPGDFRAVIPIDFAAAFDTLLNAYRSTISADKLPAFDQKMRQYRLRTRTTYSALWSSFAPYIIISNHPKPPVPVPGAVTLYFELQNDRPNARAAQNRIESLLNMFMDSPDPQRLGDSVVRHDRDNRMYYLQLEESGTLRIPSWGWAGDRFLIGGWGPPVVTANRDWLENR